MEPLVYRGRHNGYWFYGDLITTHTGETYIVSGTEIFGDSGDPDDIAVINWWKVEPETVGIYSGLEDEKGNRVFSGDILAYFIRGEIKSPSVVKFGRFVDPVDYFNYEAVGFYTVEIGGSRGELPHLVELADNLVVGNIHDNPELIKNMEAE